MGKCNNLPIERIQNIYYKDIKTEVSFIQVSGKRDV